MDITEIKSILEKQKEKLDNLYIAMNIQKNIEDIKGLEEKTLEASFWDDKENSQKIIKEMNLLKAGVDKYNGVLDIYENLYVSYELLKEELDIEIQKELEKSIPVLIEKIEELEISTLLSGEYDALNAIVTIHAGAGGTESQDWAEMLERMYIKWCEKAGFIFELCDIQEGEEAGIKGVTFMVKGMYAYGYLRGEKGVHRLVRISPFDANSRRHTSFAAVDVMPEIEDDVNIEIKPEDLEVGTYRASGAGGQHVNKTDSAVRMKHIPTGIVVSCQTERSQIQNRETCMKMLRAKLYQYELNKTAEKLKEIKGELSENAWGSQIRSYVFCPYTMVKDHRTNYEAGNVQGVMDGNIFPFITEYLKCESTNNLKER